jgi:hypothetical protein
MFIPHRFSLCLCAFVVKSKNKKPAELTLQRALIPVSMLTNSAQHRRRRAARVMVVMMVPIQHETLT